MTFYDSRTTLLECNCNYLAGRPFQVSGAALTYCGCVWLVVCCVCVFVLVVNVYCVCVCGCALLVVYCVCLWLCFLLIVYSPRIVGLSMAGVGPSIAGVRGRKTLFV